MALQTKQMPCNIHPSLAEYVNRLPYGVEWTTPRATLAEARVEMMRMRRTFKMHAALVSAADGLRGSPPNTIMPLRERLARREEIMDAAMISRDKAMTVPTADAVAKGRFEATTVWVEEGPSSDDQIHPETAVAEVPHERSSSPGDEDSPSDAGFDDEESSSGAGFDAEESPSSGASPVIANSFDSKSKGCKTSGSLKSRVAAAGRFVKTCVTSNLVATRRACSLARVHRRSSRIEEKHPEMFKVALERTRRAHASAMAASHRSSPVTVPDFQPIIPELPKLAWQPEGQRSNESRRGARHNGAVSLFAPTSKRVVQP
mmetsp:Transcript_34639/g.78317  ORF Transcript_34639/g.78317 Transcript_34639/m.78317 type:complete len:317 (-) Transcript_34639:49-999(-)